MGYVDSSTWFYALICGNPECGRVFVEPPFEGEFLSEYVPMPCPGCGQIHDATEPTLADAATVLAKREDSHLDATTIAKAESLLPA